MVKAPSWVLQTLLKMLLLYEKPSHVLNTAALESLCSQQGAPESPTFLQW